MATAFWLNRTAPFPEGVVYNVTSRRSSPSILHPPPPCSLMEVIVFNNNSSFTFPCFSCSGFTSTTNYHNQFRQCLTDAISNAVVLPSPHCAAFISEDILHSVLLPANSFYADLAHTVKILVHAPIRLREQEEEQDGVNRVLGESFEEVRPQRRPCKIEAVIKMVAERAELEALEGDDAESDWNAESEIHECVICMERMESVWDALKMPCSHFFHEKCLLRWLEDNNVCPLCRFEMPLENLNDV